MTIAAIPIIELDDPAELVDLSLPVLTITFDERQTCRLAHDLLAEVAYDLADASAAIWIMQTCGQLPRSGSTCTSNRNGWCGGAGWDRPCLFEEDPTDPASGWARAGQLRSLPNGVLCYLEDYADIAANLAADALVAA